MSDRDLIDRYAALPEEARRLVDEFVDLLGRAYAPAAPTSRGGVLEESGFFGMWADRPDFAHPDYVRELRRREWREPT